MSLYATALLFGSAVAWGLASIRRPDRSVKSKWSRRLRHGLYQALGHGIARKKRLRRSRGHRNSVARHAELFCYLETLCLARFFLLAFRDHKQLPCTVGA